MRRLGFEQHTCTDTGVLYWYLQRAGASTEKGLVLLHGFGMGSVPYIPVLKVLMDLGYHSRILVPEVRHVQATVTLTAIGLSV